MARRPKCGNAPSFQLTRVRFQGAAAIDVVEHLCWIVVARTNPAYVPNRRTQYRLKCTAETCILRQALSKNLSLVRDALKLSSRGLLVSPILPHLRRQHPFHFSTACSSLDNPTFRFKRPRIAAQHVDLAVGRIPRVDRGLWLHDPGHRYAPLHAFKLS